MLFILQVFACKDEQRRDLFVLVGVDGVFYAVSVFDLLLFIFEIAIGGLDNVVLAFFITLPVCLIWLVAQTIPS